MTHDQIVEEIMTRAQARGMRVHYCPDSRRCKGDAGLPDLLIVGSLRVGWIEVKSAGDEPRPDQTTWRYFLRAAGQPCEVMRAADLHYGGVNQFLDQL